MKNDAPILNANSNHIQQAVHRSSSEMPLLAYFYAPESNSQAMELFIAPRRGFPYRNAVFLTDRSSAVLYVIYAEDVADSLEKRLSVRPAHLARLQLLHDEGSYESCRYCFIKDH